MGKNRREKERKLIGAVLVSVFIVVGLLTLMTNIKKEEQKRPVPEQKIAKESKQEEPNRIRVVIKTDGFKGTEHDKVTLLAEQGLNVSYGNETKEYKPGERLTIAADNEMFQGGTIRVSAKDGGKVTVASIRRGYGEPSYRGTLELFSTSKGVTIVNELPLEEYLYAVVPSEMPASYELEALKAQAVCARSYAAKQTAGYFYPEYSAHVDDSTSFQVYGNSKEQDSTVRAVNETAGEKVWHKGQVATTYYFSTSCGRTTSAEAWGTKPSEANSYLQSVELKNEDGYYEEDLPWYSWKAVVPQKQMEELICKNTDANIGTLQSIEVTKRGPGGVAIQIVAVGSKRNVTVDTENKIRRALGGNGYVLEKRDGSTAKSKELLPSAFFEICKKDGNYIIEGGGFGHGIGMSQNGANEMAKAGKNYQEILKTFYQGIEVKK